MNMVASSYGGEVTTTFAHGRISGPNDEPNRERERQRERQHHGGNGNEDKWVSGIGVKSQRAVPT